MFFIDIAVPRDVDPEINSVEGVFVYNIDDLQAVAVSNMSSRAKEAMDAEVIIRTEVERYTQRMQSLNGVPSIVALQQTLEDVRQNEMRRIAPRLAHLTSEQLQAVEQMTRALVHKLQHAPIQAIKRAAQEGDRETLAVIQNVFDLEHHEKVRRSDWNSGARLPDRVSRRRDRIRPHSRRNRSRKADAASPANRPRQAGEPTLIRIGSRGSALARWQADHIAAELRASRSPGLD